MTLTRKPLACAAARLVTTHTLHFLNHLNALNQENMPVQPIIEKQSTVARSTFKTASGTILKMRDDVPFTKFKDAGDYPLLSFIYTERSPNIYIRCERKIKNLISEFKQKTL